MTIEELQHQLEDMIAQGTNPDTQLRVAHQPNYPLAAEVANITEVDGTVWIAVDDTGYAPTQVWG